MWRRKTLPAPPTSVLFGIRGFPDCNLRRALIAHSSFCLNIIIAYFLVLHFNDYFSATVHGFLRVMNERHHELLLYKPNTVYETLKFAINDKTVSSARSWLVIIKLTQMGCLCLWHGHLLHSTWLSRQLEHGVKWRTHRVTPRPFFIILTRHGQSGLIIKNNFIFGALIISNLQAPTEIAFDVTFKG